jgi:hypothetical protein
VHLFQKQTAPENVREAYAERFKIGASFTNVLNHPSIVDDSDHFNLDIGSAAFGQISAVRGADFGGSRTGQIFARIEF